MVRVLYSTASVAIPVGITRLWFIATIFFENPPRSRATPKKLARWQQGSLHCPLSCISGLHPPHALHCRKRMPWLTSGVSCSICSLHSFFLSSGMGFGSTMRQIIPFNRVHFRMSSKPAAASMGRSGVLPTFNPELPGCLTNAMVRPIRSTIGRSLLMVAG